MVNCLPKKWFRIEIQGPLLHIFFFSSPFRKYHTHALRQKFSRDTSIGCISVLIAVDFCNWMKRGNEENMAE